MTEKYWRDWEVVDKVTITEQDMLEHWGERCDTYQKGCSACDAWKHFDETGEVIK
jgi:hypothetical protein